MKRVISFIQFFPFFFFGFFVFEPWMRILNVKHIVDSMQYAQILRNNFLMYSATFALFIGFILCMRKFAPIIETGIGQIVAYIIIILVLPVTMLIKMSV